MYIYSKEAAYIEQQRQPGNSLHGQDEEGEHRKASTFTAALQLLQSLFECSVSIP